MTNKNRVKNHITEVVVYYDARTTAIYIDKNLWHWVRDRHYAFDRDLRAYLGPLNYSFNSLTIYTSEEDLQLGDIPIFDPKLLPLEKFTKAQEIKHGEQEE